MKLRRCYQSLLLTACVFSAPNAFAETLPRFTPPSTPLVACDPYFSVWSNGRSLTDEETKHWTGKSHRLGALITIDGAPYRLMGSTPESVPPLSQSSQEVRPTQTIYHFAGAGVRVEFRFTTPSLPHDIDLLSRPITYVTCSVASLDGEPHKVSLRLDASAELCVDTPNQRARVEVEQGDNHAVVKMGSVDQPVLARRGDDLRIDWGYFYMAAPGDAGAATAVGELSELRSSYLAGEEQPRAESVTDEAGKLGGGVTFELGSVGESPVSRWVVLAYDDLYSIQFMSKNLRPYWRRDGMTAAELLSDAIRDYQALQSRCDAFDNELVSDLREAGGDDYALLGSLAYRQCFAAGKFVADDNGQPIQFCKENNSNGCIGTSDVFYPMAPQFLLFGPSLAKSFLVPFMEYAKSDRWKFPFAPHDLGTYPKANGQVYGGGETSVENQMPVEECGNLLLLMAAVAHLEQDTAFADRYWPQLTQWAEYLREEGFDPDNQLCTDDFAGHLAHNVNLSAKAICGLAAYARLCEMRGDVEEAKEYRGVAEQFAAKWIKEADDNGHYRLTFDRPNSWSQKYNLVWDRVLGLDLYPSEVFRKEMDHYLSVQNRYGLPLDSRKKYTKLDWVLWTACLTGDEDFKALVAPVVSFLRETPHRAPMTDWYRTHDATKVGFTARPVVGGVFMRLLCDDQVWRKWADRETTRAGGYAPMPLPPVVREVVTTSKSAPTEWRFTNNEPGEGWSQPTFDDSEWRLGKSGFGRSGTPNANIQVRWHSSDIWLRRGFDLDKVEDISQLKLYMHHDEDAQVYLNGVLAASLPGYTTGFELVPIHEEALKALRAEGNTLAVHCRNSTGGQFIDVGLARVEPQTPRDKRVAGDAFKSK